MVLHVALARSEAHCVAELPKLRQYYQVVVIFNPLLPKGTGTPYVNDQTFTLPAPVMSVSNFGRYLGIIDVLIVTGHQPDLVNQALRSSIHVLHYLPGNSQKNPILHLSQPTHTWWLRVFTRNWSQHLQDFYSLILGGSQGRQVQRRLCPSPPSRL